MTLKELQKMIKEEMNSYTNEAAYGPSRADMDAAEERSANVKAGKWSDGRVQNKSMQREEDEVDVSVSDDDIDVDAEFDSGDEDGSDEDILRNIYDMLKAKFEGGEEEGEEGDEEMPMDDVEGEEAEDSDLDEWTGKNDPKPGGKGRHGFDEKVGGKGRSGYDESSKALQERFQKLANIIK